MMIKPHRRMDLIKALKDNWRHLMSSSDRDDLMNKESKLNQLKDLYERESSVYNKRYSPLFHVSMEIEKLKAKIAVDKSADKDDALGKIKDLQKQLTESEMEVKKLLGDLEIKMKQIATLEKELYGKNASKPDSPDILEKKDIYSKIKK
jgi:hypothetical protein